jgi:ADP-heptose:LPS heptosyltransferase
MKIDTQTGWFKGVGDLVCFAWIGAGMRAAGQEVEFYAQSWRAELMSLFKEKVTQDPTDMVSTLSHEDGYEQAVKNKSPLNYLDWICARLGVTAKPQRPKMYLRPTDRQLGRSVSGTVLVFPHCIWAPRTWPKSYFVELVWYLKRAKIDVRVVTEQRDGAFLFVPCIYGKSLSYVAAAIQVAKLVIGNDSGPAHLAGTIGTPTLAIQGPTQERIYSYLPEVVSYRKKVLPCAGCHCLPPFRDSCNVGCHELYRTFPEDIYAKALEMLGLIVNTNQTEAIAA